MQYKIAKETLKKIKKKKNTRGTPPTPPSLQSPLYKKIN